MIMNQNAITMTVDNSRNRKQANHPGPVCILICICSIRGRADGLGGKWEEVEEEVGADKEEEEEAPTSAGRERGRREGVAGPSKGLSSLPLVACCFPLLCQGPLNLLHHSNKAPSITGAPPSMRSTEERRGEAGAHKQDKRPHKRARGNIKPCRLPPRLAPRPTQAAVFPSQPRCHCVGVNRSPLLCFVHKPTKNELFSIHTRVGRHSWAGKKILKLEQLSTLGG